MEKNNNKPEQLTDAEFITSINQYFWLVVITSSNTDAPIKTRQLFSAMASCIKNKSIEVCPRFFHETTSGSRLLNDPKVKCS